MTTPIPYKSIKIQITTGFSKKNPVFFRKKVLFPDCDVPPHRLPRTRKASGNGPDGLNGLNGHNGPDGQFRPTSSASHLGVNGVSSSSNRNDHPNSTPPVDLPGRPPAEARLVMNARSAEARAALNEKRRRPVEIVQSAFSRAAASFFLLSLSLLSHGQHLEYLEYGPAQTATALKRRSA